MAANRMELRLAGSGGQGVILASIILAETALMAGWNVAQTQSYGPEARGGKCRAEVVICDGPIGFFHVQKPTFLLTLTQQCLDEYAKNLADGCLVMSDESLTIPDWLTARVIRVPILRTATEVVGRAFTANIVAVGAINRVLSLGTAAQLRQTVEQHVPKGTGDINALALEAGAGLIP